MWLLVTCILAVWAVPATTRPASSAPAAMAETASDLSWHLNADELEHDRRRNVYIARGNVSVVRGDRKLVADFVEFDHKAMTVEARGHVLLTSGADVLIGERASMNLESETGTLFQGTVFLAQNHFYISGAEIHRIDRDTYILKQARVSTCDGDRPAWKITGRNLKVDVEGYASVHHTAFWVKNVPLFYLPFMVFPVKTQRQSGLLTPQLAVSERKGFEMVQPYYWAINRQSDATFYGHYMSQRGMKIGGEYRWILSDLSRGVVMADFLEDRQIDDGTGNSSTDWGYPDDTYLRPNSDRYWLRAKADQALPDGFTVRLDVDILSDQDYLAEFKDGYTGYTASNDALIDFFGRGVDDYNDAVRSNILNISRNWAAYRFNGQLRWDDDVIQRRLSADDDTLQQLPSLTFEASKQSLGDTDWYFDLNSEYTYFFRQNGPAGHRANVHPRIYRPIRLADRATFEPSLGLRETAWYAASPMDPDARTYHRELLDLGLDLSSEMYRIFQLDSQGNSRLKHTLRPQVVYTYVPDVDQNINPWFDDQDRIDGSSRITYSLTNFFTTRQMVRRQASDSAEGPKTDSDDLPQAVYTQMGRLKIEQSYHCDTSTDPFSPVEAELELNLPRYARVQADAGYSVYDAHFVSRNIALHLSDLRGDALQVEHRYARDASESLYLRGVVTLSQPLTAYAEFERDLFGKKDLNKSIGMQYAGQCWSIDLKFAEEIADRKFAFMINFLGLGGIGSSI